jgi:peptide deformylase
MVIKKTTQIGNSIIRAKAKSVKEIKSPGVQKIVKNLIDSMRFHELVGMAAPQIGESQRIFVTEIRKTVYRKKGKELDSLRVFINPKIISSSSSLAEAYEGCGSVDNAGLFGSVRRAKSLTVEAYDQNGKKFKLIAKGLLARIVQHENDHINGIVFLDRVKNFKTVFEREEYIKFVNRKK